MAGGEVNGVECGGGWGVLDAVEGSVAAHGDGGVICVV